MLRGENSPLETGSHIVVKEIKNGDCKHQSLNSDVINVTSNEKNSTLEIKICHLASKFDSTTNCNF